MRAKKAKEYRMYPLTSEKMRRPSVDLDHELLSCSVQTHICVRARTHIFLRICGAYVSCSAGQIGAHIW